MPPQTIPSSSVLPPTSTPSPYITPIPTPLLLQTNSDVELRSTIVFGIFSTCLAALGLVFAAFTLRFMYKYHRGQTSTVYKEDQMDDGNGGSDVEMQMQMQRFNSVSRESTLRDDDGEVGEDEGRKGKGKDGDERSGLAEKEVDLDDQ